MSANTNSNNTSNTSNTAEACPVQFNKDGSKPATLDEKPKPCCVCLDEKRARDECLMFKGFEDESCLKLIDSYKSCMKSFGFDIWVTLQLRYIPMGRDTLSPRSIYIYKACKYLNNQSCILLIKNTLSIMKYTFYL